MFILHVECTFINYRKKDTAGGSRDTHWTHTGHTRDTRAHAGKRITRTNLTTIHPNPKTHIHRNCIIVLDGSLLISVF